MTNPTLPLAWLDTMSRVRSVLPSAFLAGGALRDLDNGREVKDLDVFFTEEAYNIAALEDGLAKQGYFYQSRCGGAYMTDAAGEVDGSTVYRSREGGPDLNLIQLTPGFNTAAIIDRVDFGLCQIGLDALGVVKTAAYDHDKANQRLTLTRADSVEGVMRSIKRYNRLSQKYQGWEFYWLPHHDAIVEEAQQRLKGAEVSLF
ncbi:hypothetical protein JQ617_08125 [Bradyrhizobium sp. KB893862 SZCCT0404]|uniref:hypothetical protein n=1 Tax=Bradyrhizobium sp. KB893862 SZCCT0404 TaxID=2807672 RepID=UPI001BA98A50|nr:hypothetical protein [Bradyrhizobium sp. KB893862 SZCCT0404]MBR1173917.1 hypothetical protein [Bradyrhizobium sp. KB893862 SZCCT0404]